MYFESVNAYHFRFQRRRRRRRVDAAGARSLMCACAMCVFSKHIFIDIFVLLSACIWSASALFFEVIFGSAAV